MPDNDPSPVPRLLQFARRHWRIAAAQLVLAVLGTSLVLVFPGVVKWFLDDIIPRRDMSALYQAAGLAAGAFALRELLFAIRTKVNTAFEQRMIFDLRGQLHRKIARMPVAWFDRQSTGDIITRMADDVPSTQRVILEGIEQGVTSLLQIVIAGAMMFITSWKLALFVMLPTPWIAAGGWIYARWVTPRAKAAKEASSRLNSHLHDTVTGIRQIKSYTAEDAKQADFNASSENLRRAQTRLMTAWSVYHPLMSFLGHMGLVLLLAVGSWWVIRDADAVKALADAGQPVPGDLMTLGVLFQFIFLIGIFFEPISRLHGVNQTMVSGLASARRVFAVLDHDDEEDLESGCGMSMTEGEITFRDVTFSYNDRPPAVQGISFTVLPRQTVAIVGATGSGKSTLFQLLTRFYDPQQGSIEIDRVPITEYSKASLREHIGYVTQDTFLFAGSIRENLLLGNPAASDVELWRALKLACADEFVRAMEKNLDTEVGERGVRLSGGERQRIAIARAFLRNAPILLLDEATSAVDNKSERLIQQAIEQLRHDRTSLVIAHRLSTVISADRIHVMRLGKIIASGAHEELLKTCPYYAELAALALEEEAAKQSIL